MLRRVLKWVIIAGLGMVALLLVVTGISYVAADTPSPVAKTVVDEPSLPSLDVNGVRLHLQTFGDPSNPVVVVLHGGPGDDHRMLLPLVPLSDDYFLVFYDQRGSGLSQRVTDDELTYEAMRDELGAIVDHFSPNDPVRIIGHSWGAMLASGYLGQHPDRVLQFVLAEPGFLTPEAGAAFLEVTGGMPSLSSELISALWWTWMESLHLDGPDDDAQRDYFMLRIVITEIEDHPMAGYFCGRKPNPETMPHFRFGTRASLVVRSQAMAADGSLIAPFADGVEAYAGKVLFMTGACNTYIGAEHQKKFHLSLFKNAELVVIDDAGHMMFGDKPQRSLKVLRAYFAEAQSATARQLHVAPVTPINNGETVQSNVAAVQHADRPEEDRRRDVDRKPSDVLTFFGIETGMQVAELMVGRGYYTEILSRAVGPAGVVWAQNNKYVLDRFADGPLTERLQRLEPHNVRRLNRELHEPGLPQGKLDAVLMVLFYHDTYWQKVPRDAMNKAVFAALKPGGIYGIVDHAAAAGTKDTQVKTLHRIEQALLTSEILAAGFTLDAQSDILRHPEDDHSLNVFDESIRGKTDRFVLRFRKPAAP